MCEKENPCDYQSENKFTKQKKRITGVNTDYEQATIETDNLLRNQR